MTNGRTTPIARRIAFTAAISLTLISAACCAIFGWQMGLHHSPLLALLMAGAALAAECLKPLAVVAALEAARAWRLFSALLFCVLAAVSISYSVAAELSLASSVRDDNAGKRQHAMDRLDRAERLYKATESQLAALAGALQRVS